MRNFYLILSLLSVLWLNSTSGTNSKDAVLVFGGDVMLARGVKQAMDAGIYQDPFLKIKPIFDDADFVLVNLEMAIDPDCQPVEKRYSLHGGCEAAEILAEAGIDAVSIANNHSFDCGCEGFERTRKIVKEKGILTIGDENDPKKINIKGTSIGIMGFVKTHFEGDKIFMSCQPLIFFSGDAFQKAGELKKQVDLVIVVLHWGSDFDKSPTHGQRQAAHKLIEAGADIIIGSGPHMLQEVEIYQNGLIAYSLGNLVFDQKVRGAKGALLEVRVQKGQILSKKIIPVFIDKGQPGLEIK
jgi:poly-gamma-glutamate capsule biosynthesis protein CapA/YwtB (metallophosphatase superfamily)